MEGLDGKGKEEKPRAANDNESEARQMLGVLGRNDKYARREEGRDEDEEEGAPPQNLPHDLEEK